MEELKFGSEAVRSHENSKQISGIYYILWGVPGGSAVKNSPASAGDPDSVVGAGRSPGGGNGRPASLPGRLSVGSHELDMTEQLHHHHHCSFFFKLIN